MTVHPTQLVEVIAAMRSIQTEADRWTLAEALYAEIPTGQGGFDKIVDVAAAEGVPAGLKANTLRLYRDTAHRWPASKRVANVTFSAHREAMVMPSIDAAAKMLADLAKNLGADKVTVASVRRAVAVSQGKTITAAKSGNSPVAASFDALADLKAGASTIITSITADTSAADLDLLHAGLTKAIAHVERLRSKAARKATAAKSTAKSSTKPATVTAAKAARVRKGDLRGI
jgi:hypothetical protein